MNQCRLKSGITWNHERLEKHEDFRLEGGRDHYQVEELLEQGVMGVMHLAEGLGFSWVESVRGKAFVSDERKNKPATDNGEAEIRRRCRDAGSFSGTES